MQLLLLLQQLLYFLPSLTSHKQLIRQNTIKITQHTQCLQCDVAAYLLLFADLLPGLKVVGLPISFHDPELSLQFGYL